MRPEPVATYRLQLHRGFDFAQAAAIADYLRALGVSHVYCSPCLQAAPRSTHGYDVVDPTRVSDDLGGVTGWNQFRTALRAAGLGQILDIVPNHMSVASRENAWWWDVLANGPSSRYAKYFDIDWHAAGPASGNTLLLTVLSNECAHAVAAGTIRLELVGDELVVAHHQHQFPLATGSLEGILPLPASAVAVNRLNRDAQALLQLLERQHYQLAHWRVCRSHLGYRRFFDINDLVGVRVEDEAVFAATHALILKWLAQGELAGVRIDHIDGLRDPAGYLQRLHAAAPEAWILVEKILGHDELLPSTWPAHGTTGYDFANLVTGLLIDADGEQPLTEFYAEFTGEPTDFAAVVHDKKRQALVDVLGGDVHRLLGLLTQLATRHTQLHCYSAEDLEAALRELIITFPVYRSYVCPRPNGVTTDDVRHVESAITAARQARPELDGTLLDFLRAVLLLRIDGDLEQDFALRFQQLTGPAMAKGVEDAAFYCFNRLVALNEVGGDPGRFSVDPAEFHRACEATQRVWPLTMLATSTHDTKRSEDVRARISLLAEIPETWCAAVQRWSAHNVRHRTKKLPDRNAEYLCYQTLVGAWPISADRATAYMEKATREAKQYTSWTDPNAAYDRALQHFVRGILTDAEYVADLERFVAPLLGPAAINALAQTLLKLTAPGVPDIYQGTELTDLSLVDPDNRREVDYGLRRRLLDETDTATPEAIWSRAAEGLPKLYVLRNTLALRRAHPEWFGTSGDYQPLLPTGPKAKHAVAFVRGGHAITLVPRLPIRLGGDWTGTTLALPPGTWCDAFTGERAHGVTAVAQLFRRFPVVLLSREQEKASQA